jgi:hypothetical protein
MAAPVRGLRPVRAARLPTEKEPKPTKETVPPFLSVFLTASTMDSRARVAAALEMSECLAMCSTSSVLFTIYVPMFVGVQIVIQSLCSLMTKHIQFSRGFPEVV